MIDWKNAPDDATHAVLHDGGLITWAKIEDDKPVMVYCELTARWISVAITWASVLIDYDIIARPAPRTVADELLDMIREQKRKAFEMGYEQAYMDIKHGGRPDKSKAVRAYINQQEQQS